MNNEIYDLIVVGAGPAGIAAAVTAGEHGKSVVIIDDNPKPGGQIWRHLATPPKSPGAQAWISRLCLLPADRVVRLSGARIIAQTRRDINSISLLVHHDNGESRLLIGRKVILATGSRELFLPFPGWTLPGVMGVGGMQALIKSGMPVEGKRVLVTGTGPLLLAVAELLVLKGAKVVGIWEQAPLSQLVPLGMSLWRTPSKIIQGLSIQTRLLGIPQRFSTWATSVTRSPSGELFVVGSSGESLICDQLVCGFHLIPNTELAESMGCQLDEAGTVRVDNNLCALEANIYAVGELTGVGGVEKSLIEGQFAGHLLGGHPELADSLRSARQKWSRFSSQLSNAFRLQASLLTLSKSDTLICRCEDVSHRTVSMCKSSRDAKLQTRCGMGPCQGRICGPILEQVFGMDKGTVRAPLMAVSVDSLRLGACSGSCNKMKETAGT